MNAYRKAIREEMKILGKMKNTIFLGQQVGVTNFYGTLNDVSMKKRIELPVAEEMQMGLSIGLSLEGYLPISIYQRMDFLPRAMDQIVNHLDKLEEMSCGIYKPKVIIRTTIGTRKPFDCGCQHSQDLTKAFEKLVSFPVVKVRNADEVKAAYIMARDIDRSIIIIEIAEKYND